MKSILLFGDAHLEQEIDTHTSYILFKKVAQTVKPSTLIIGGDLLDFDYISRFTEGIPGAVEGKRLKDDLETFEEELRFFKKCSKEVVFLMGNHEERLNKFLLKNPVLQGIISFEEICEKVGVKFVPTYKQPYKLLEDLYVVHGLCFNKYYASKIAEQVNENIISFHTHRTQNYSISYPSGKVVTGYGIGCLCDTNPMYLAGTRVTGHTNSFAHLTVSETGAWQLNTIMVKNNTCIVNNRLFSLMDSSTN